MHELDDSIRCLMSRCECSVPLAPNSLPNDHVDWYIQPVFVRTAVAATGLCVRGKKPLGWACRASDRYNLLGLAGGQLTGRGMNQAKDLGQYLAAQYVGSGKLLDAAFENQHVEAWSTPVDRTLMSAQVCVPGMCALSDELSTADLCA